MTGWHAQAKGAGMACRRMSRVPPASSACRCPTPNPPTPNPRPQIPDPKSNPLPLLDRRGASGMLDWITGAIAAQPTKHVTWMDGDGAAPDTLFSIRNYTAGEMSDWSTTPAPVPAAGDKLDRLARMAALNGPPTTLESSPIVSRVARRLTTPYKAKALSRVPAVAAASVLKRRWNAMEDETDPAAMWVATEGRASPPVIYQRSFKSPDFMSTPAAPAATRVGTWTHEFLQRVDPTRPCDRQDLKGTTRRSRRSWRAGGQRGRGHRSRRRRLVLRHPTGYQNSVKIDQTAEGVALYPGSRSREIRSEG